ncbi:hypothetical protein GCM10008935_11770 [Alkalibacillus silvisoli]|uniref:Transglutaminase-like domain-containing protein n=1 Tax=Alkalibacillus silvisoli TaxID=392823 RepID=A0ABN0ZTA7_9BACI
MKLCSLPNFKIDSMGKVSREVLDLGLQDFHQVVKFVHELPYGRTTDRSDYHLVLREGKGTCSTKHALLSALCIEQKYTVLNYMQVFTK